MNTFFINKLKPNELKTIAYFTGIICIILGIFLFLPAICAYIFNDELRFKYAFLVSAIITLTAGILIIHFYGKKNLTNLSLKGSLIFVFTIWGVTAIFSALPYYFSGSLNFLDSCFQAMSGITTTGFSLLEITRAPYSLAFWGAFTQWFGGLGIIIFILVIIPTSTNLKRLYFAEGRTEQMTPNIKHTAMIFIKLYLALTIISVSSYLFFGLSVFDSICYGITSIATGGLSIFPESVNYFNEVPLQAITTILMLLGSTNFILLYRVIKGNFKAYYKDSEVKTMFIIMTIATILISLSLYANHTYGSNIFTTIRQALFQVISIMSSTGFTSTNINIWPPFCYHIMIILMICGGGICSTASGIKLYNVYILFKTLRWEGQSIFLPKNSVIVKKVYHDGRYIDLTNDQIRPVLIYILVYIMIFLFSATIILAYSHDIQISYLIAASAIGNIGLGPDFVNITTPIPIKIIMIIEFWIGRTGVWPILLLIVYEINKINGKLNDIK